MKKLITLSAILAVSVATVAEAKRGGGFRSMSSSKAISTKPVTKNQPNSKETQHLQIRQITQQLNRKFAKVAQWPMSQWGRRQAIFWVI